MRIIVLGGGLIGVTTAYELGKRGFAVTVIDRRDGCAGECSYANGGQLSYSHAEPWATPSLLPKLPKWLLSPDSPLVVRPRLDWQMIRWGLAFLRNCTPARARLNCVNILRLGLYSKEKFAQMRNDIAFDYSPRGILHMFGAQKDFEGARRHNDFQAKFGGEERVLTRDECLALEPALAHTSRPIVGGMHAFRDELGDAYLFSRALTKLAAERYGVEFRGGIAVEGLRMDTHRVAAVMTSHGDLTADGYVMALGSYSAIHLNRIGIGIPVYPMKGYSVTIPANEFCPQLSVTDTTYKVVYTPLGNRLRIAGTAEFAGYNDAMNEKRIAPILRAAKSMLPKADWNAPMEKWACLRPSTPDGPPVLGRTPYANLFLNTGHGTLGWTQAAGSAAIVADIMEGKTPDIMLSGLTLEGRV